MTKVETCIVSCLKLAYLIIVCLFYLTALLTVVGTIEIIIVSLLWTPLGQAYM